MEVAYTTDYLQEKQIFYFIKKYSYSNQLAELDIIPYYCPTSNSLR